MLLHAVNAAYHQPELADFCRQNLNAACGLAIQTAWSCACVCLQVLHTGEISEQAPIPAVTESVLRSSELREGTTVSLDQQVTCSVAFAKGQERRVFFAVQGLPQVCIWPQVSLLLVTSAFCASLHMCICPHWVPIECFSLIIFYFTARDLQLIASIESAKGVQAHPC